MEDIELSKSPVNSPGDVVEEDGGSDSSAPPSNGLLSHAGQRSFEDLEAYFASFPPGYRFKPDDEELVLDYLEPKVRNMRLPPNRIRDVELYKFSPDDLAAAFPATGKHQKEWYFFTPRDRKYRNGERPNRAAGNGYWKATGADKPIKKDNEKVGFRKALVFYRGKPPRGDKTDWIMHEYRVNNPPKRTRGGNDMRLDDWVLCRMYKKTDKCSNKVSNRQQDVAGDNTNPENALIQGPNYQLENSIAQIPVDNSTADHVSLMPSNGYSMPHEIALNHYPHAATIGMYNNHEYSMNSHNKIIFPAAPHVPFDQYPLLDHPHNNNFSYMMPDQYMSTSNAPYPLIGRFKNEEFANFQDFSSIDSAVVLESPSDLSSLDHFNPFDHDHDHDHDLFQ